MRVLPIDRVASKSISDKKETNGLSIPNQAKNVKGISLKLKGTLLDRSDWINLSRISDVLQLSQHSIRFLSAKAGNNTPSFANRR
jgi:hypothetical protein